MTLTQIIELVRSQLRDENDEFISDAEIVMWVNVAQRDLADRLHLIQGEVDNGLVAGSRLPLPTEFLEANSLRVGGETFEFVDDEQFQAALDGDIGAPSNVARIFNGYIELAPRVADNVTYDLRYTSGPTDLALATPGNSSVLPAELHPKLAWYATAQALLKEREEGLSDRFITMYAENLPSSSNGQHRLHPGPFRLRFETNPWDYEGTHVGVGGYGS